MKATALILMMTAMTSLSACAQMEPETEGRDVTAEFVHNYTGKFEDSQFKESFVIEKNGNVSRTLKRQVGREGTPVPYPTVCEYTMTGKIKTMWERSKKKRDNYMDFATHKLDVEYSSIELIGASQMDMNCQVFIGHQKARGPFADSDYMELLGENSFRMHTSGGGDYTQGGERTESTLDEVYNRLADKEKNEAGND